MIWFILAILIIIYVGKQILYNPDLSDWVIMIVMTILIGLMAFLVCIAGSVITSSVVDMDYECTQTTEIVTLKDNIGIKGGYYVFGGYTNDDLNYYYAEKENGGYYVRHVSARNTEIRYTEETPRLELYTATSFKNKLVYIFGFPCRSKNILYVPEGTLTTDFVIDLQ